MEFFLTSQPNASDELGDVAHMSADTIKDIPETPVALYFMAVS